MSNGKHVSDPRTAPAPSGDFTRTNVAISASGNTDLIPTPSGEFTNFNAPSGKQRGVEDDR